MHDVVEKDELAARADPQEKRQDDEEEDGQAAENDEEHGAAEKHLGLDRLDPFRNRRGPFGLAVADLLLMGSVWARLFRLTGGSTSWWHGVRVWVVTNFGRYIPGKVWQLGGLTAYMKARGESGAAALVSAVAFQVVALVTGTAIAAATVGLRWAADGVDVVPALVILMVLLAVGLHPAVLRAATRRLGRLMGESEVTVQLRGVAKAAFCFTSAPCRPLSVSATWGRKPSASPIFLPGADRPSGRSCR